MAWTQKILTPRPFSNCTVVSQQLAVLTCNLADSGVFVYYPLLSFLCNADTNGDGYFDEQELEALFTKEVKPWFLKTFH